MSETSDRRQLPTLNMLFYNNYLFFAMSVDAETKKIYYYSMKSANVIGRLMSCLDPALWDIRQAATVRRSIHVQPISHTDEARG